MGRGKTKFQSKHVQQREEKRVVKITTEQKTENLKKQTSKEKRSIKQAKADSDFERSGITEKDIEDAEQMDKAEIKRLINRAVENGVEQSEVKDHIDFDTTFRANVRKSPVFAKSLKDFKKPDELTKFEREWAEDFYLAKAEQSPKKAITDSKKADKPVRSQITKSWIKSPTSKKGADIEGIDDGTEPFTEDDF